MTIKAILTDIEGTTSSISFVKDVLFPFARKALPDFIADHADDDSIKALLEDTAELADTPNASRAELVTTLQQWIDEDRKATPLKQLQGMIWRAGYENGEYTAHLYPDAAQQLKAWHEQGLALYVYSSGSIAAQKLFFHYSDFGDLRSLFKGHFDTTSGGKQSADSYRNITASIGLPPQQILFLSDVAEELDAATEAGMQVAHVVRKADGTKRSRKYPARKDFTAIDKLTAA